MTEAEVWDRLGIAPTSDERGIKRAYAVQLKAIDSDADPAAFEALRAVYEHAIWFARNQDHADTNDYGLGSVGDDERPAEANDDLAVLQTAPAEPETVIEETTAEDPEEDRYARRANALFAILTAAERDVPLDQAEADEAYHNALVVLSDPALDQVDRQADVSRWFAYVLANSSPRSDPVVAMVADHFGWRADIKLVDEDPAVAFLMERLAAITFWHEISTPGHHFHKAWKELTLPANDGSKPSWNAPGKRVRELLAATRQQHPIAEDWYDQWRVSLWDNGVSRVSTGGLWLAIFLFVTVFGFFTDDRRNVTQPVYVPAVSSTIGPQALVDEDADVAAVIKAFFGDSMTVAELVKVNPELSMALRSNWQIKRDNGEGRDVYVRQMIDLLFDRARTYTPRSGSDLELAVVRHRLDVLKALSSDPASCERQLQGGKGPYPALPAALRGQEQALFRRVAGEGVPPTESSDTSFRVPAEVVAKIRTSTGLSGNALTDALMLRGPARNQCRAAVALIEAALDLPAERRRPLLKHL